MACDAGEVITSTRWCDVAGEGGPHCGTPDCDCVTCAAADGGGVQPDGGSSSCKYVCPPRVPPECDGGTVMSHACGGTCMPLGCACSGHDCACYVCVR